MVMPPQQKLIEQAYNAIPYQSLALEHTHPKHLFTLAKLYGLSPTPCEKARVLELGCASGDNLIPMAMTLPNASFLGIDIAARQIELGIRQIQALNLANINLRQQSISEFTSNDKFDYIICHGVYSWVDENTREHILKLCSENLSENGVVYISYNTLPGWHTANVVRELLLWHTQHNHNPFVKVKEGKEILSLMLEELKDKKSPYAQLLKSEINVLKDYPDSQIIHETFSAENQPCYFYQFVEQALKFKLAYLSDASLLHMSPDIKSLLLSEEEKSKNLVGLQQIEDFLENRRFRATLLCHEYKKVKHVVTNQNIESFYLQLNPMIFKDRVSDEELQVRFSPTDSFLQQFLHILSQKQDMPLSYLKICELFAQSQGESQETIKAQLLQHPQIIQWIFKELIIINAYPADYTLSVSTKPCACPLARLQAQTQSIVTNRRHQNVELSPFAQILLPLLEGNRTQDKIVDIILSYIKTDDLVVLDENDQRITEFVQAKSQVEKNCQQAFALLAKQALLIS